MGLCCTYTTLRECLVEEGSTREKSGAGVGINKSRHDKNWLGGMRRVPPSWLEGRNQGKLGDQGRLHKRNISAVAHRTGQIQSERQAGRTIPGRKNGMCKKKRSVKQYVYIPVTVKYDWNACFLWGRIKTGARPQRASCAWWRRLEPDLVGSEEPSEFKARKGMVIIAGSVVLLPWSRGRD